MIKLTTGLTGTDKDGKTYVFGPPNRLVILYDNNGHPMSRTAVYKDIIEIEGNKGYKIEHDIIFEDDTVQRVFIMGTAHNLKLLEAHQEEQLWES